VERFIAGQVLASTIQDICSGGQIRCAVAFWGKGIPNVLLGASISKARIICNVEMGGTNPAALRELKAPKNKHLRHHPGLHSKVYISDRGVVTASANASVFGLGGVDQPPRLAEAGVYSTATSDHWNEAHLWFEELWATSKALDEDALAQAEESWKRASNARALLARLAMDKPRSLSDLLIQRPDAFGDIQFFFTNEPLDKEAYNAAIEEIEEVDGVASAQTLRKMAPTTGWGGSNHAPYRFIHVHRGPRGGCWATLASSGVYIDTHDVYFAHRHQLKDQLFSDLLGYLDLGGYGSWGGYRLRLNYFTAEQVEELVGGFRTAEEVSQILLGK